MDIVTTSNFHATLLQGRLSVVFVPTEHIRRCSWPLLNLLLYGGCSFDENESCAMDEGHICRSVQSEMFSVVLDKDGATLFMDPNGVEMFKYADMDDLISIAPYSWRAIQIHLGPMVAEFPGVISFLSKLLAEDNISILNMSTYDTDIIYVQRCLSSFTEDSIIVSPDRWRAIKLSGRTYGFDETGVVAAMSGFDTETQVLNVSSFGSNVALVLDHTLEESIATLCSSLQISRVERL
ncbi:TPA: hypothetical protein N0F65_005463 [Lagenidium giganteum]|uniref:CASTOR ACT domain-containing protein n=1 Tax=Lagenidium giganteum TaxID=4803 RepID=A0AAV2YYZ7_9STRA|nr:TPA: hypothetical protein N0F65_005463 [Lagenidium giganteum]